MVKKIVISDQLSAKESRINWGVKNITLKKSEYRRDWAKGSKESIIN